MRDKTDEDNVLETVHGLMHAYRSVQYRVLRDGPHDITHMDSKVLGYFAAHPGATQSELAEHSGRDKAQLARLIKGLRERGLLASEVDEADRRSMRIRLTDEGLAVQRALKQQSKRLAVKAVSGLSPDEHRQLLGLLKRVRGNIDAEG